MLNFKIANTSIIFFLAKKNYNNNNLLDIFKSVVRKLSSFIIPLLFLEWLHCRKVVGFTSFVTTNAILHWKIPIIEILVEELLGMMHIQIDWKCVVNMSCLLYNLRLNIAPLKLNAHFKICAINHFVISKWHLFHLDQNCSTDVWPRSVFHPRLLLRPEEVKAKRSITPWGLSHPASGQSHLAWRMTLSVCCLILPVRMSPLARAYMPIGHYDLSGTDPTNDNWFNWRWWMKGFYGPWIISWWQSWG